MSFVSFWQRVWATLARTDYSSWYALASALLVGTWLLFRGALQVIRMLTSGLSITGFVVPSFVLKHLVYPHLLRRMPLVGVATRLQVLLVAIYILLNMVPNLPFSVFGSRSDIARRAATMALVNIIPLFCGPRLRLLTRLLGISIPTGIGSHQWMGRVAVAQVLLHTLLSMKGFAWSTPGIFGVVVGIMGAHRRLIR